MFAKLTAGLDFHAKALVVRAERQHVIASNIANADTPGYVARDVNFKDAMNQALGTGLSQSSSVQGQAGGIGTTNARHIPLSSTSFTSQGGASAPAYTVQTQPSVDGNSVDLDHERANFVDNSVRYEATLRFINGSAMGILSAIRGQ
jgi:flagellar basal-body rod protein FlgB